jgi:hypothetical protein
MDDKPVTAPIRFYKGVRHPGEARLADRIRYEQFLAARAAFAGDALAPGRLHGVVDAARGFAEELVHRHMDPDGPPVACKAGCATCCHQPVRLSALEVFGIVRFLDEQLPPDDRRRIIDRLHELDRATRGMPLQTRLKQPRACAFLQDGRCSIYAVRPLACAGFTSYDVRECERHSANGFNPGGVVQEKARMLAYYAVRHGLADALNTALPHADTAWLELTHAVVDALAHPGAEAAWLASEPVFAKAHLDGEVSGQA